MSFMCMPRVVRLSLSKSKRTFFEVGKLWRRSLKCKVGNCLFKKKRRVFWVLEVFLLSFGPFCASGVGALRLKMSPCGGLSLVGSLEWKKEVGVPVK